VIRQLPLKPHQFLDLFEEYGSGSIARLPRHQNGGFEVHYIAKGHLHWEIEGRPFLVPPRSVFFTFPWETHGSCVDFEPGHYFDFVVFRLQNRQKTEPAKVRLVADFGLSETEQNELFTKLMSLRSRCFAASPDFGWTLQRLVRELSQPGVMARTHVIALSRAVLCELMKSIHYSNQRRQNTLSSERQVFRILDELRTECSKSWTLDSLASACGLKRTRFETLVKEITGDTPLMLLNRFRIRQAQEFLKDSGKTITEIAFDSGFSSSQYFAKVFKGLTGITPSRYRQDQDNLAVYDRRFLKALARLQD